MRPVPWSAAAAACLASAALILCCWPSPPPRAAAQDQREQTDKRAPDVPDDPKLRELYKEFVTKAERLAREFEKARQYDKARTCYEQILKLVPGYASAETALAKLREREATAVRRSLDVVANKGWQDTGVIVLAGKPLSIRAEGTWNFRLAAQLGPDGMAIPKELRDFNLGALVGMIVAEDPAKAKPFFVGSEFEMVAEEHGRLWLRMYDADPSDNSGKLSVTIEGTFERE
jgi:tetratricopeptide (TPR) repeat protein